MEMAGGGYFLNIPLSEYVVRFKVVLASTTIPLVVIIRFTQDGTCQDGIMKLYRVCMNIGFI